MKDTFDRTIDYMRVSITDRCNLRCEYCMPDGVQLCSHEDILTYDEIVSVCREAVSLGIVKFKITGGEPLVRKDCASLIRKLYEIPGTQQVTLTTNGVLLKDQLDELKAAGLQYVNISLDTLDRDRFARITGYDSLAEVLESVNAALDAGMKVKLNAVMHDREYHKDFRQLVEMAKDSPLDVRFIEMMPIGYGADAYLVSNDTLMKELEEIYGDIEPDYDIKGNGPAVYYKIPGFRGSIGFISAIHGKFCSTCNRIRLTSVGEIKSCLCFDNGVSLKDAIRNRDSSEINRLLRESIADKPEEHCFGDLKNITERKNMIQIGG